MVKKLTLKALPYVFCMCYKFCSEYTYLNVRVVVVFVCHSLYYTPPAASLSLLIFFLSWPFYLYIHVMLLKAGGGERGRRVRVTEPDLHNVIPPLYFE